MRTLSVEPSSDDRYIYINNYVFFHICLVAMFYFLSRCGVINMYHAINDVIG